jgi:hypothetical protein
MLAGSFRIIALAPWGRGKKKLEVNDAVNSWKNGQDV